MVGNSSWDNAIAAVVYLYLKWKSADEAHWLEKRCGVWDHCQFPPALFFITSYWIIILFFPCIWSNRARHKQGYMSSRRKPKYNADYVCSDLTHCRHARSGEKAQTMTPLRWTSGRVHGKLNDVNNLRWPTGRDTLQMITPFPQAPCSNINKSSVKWWLRRRNGEH